MQLLKFPVAPLVALSLSCSGPAFAQVASCEQLRQTVETKIRSKGVAGFSIQVVEATSTAQGQVVGSCERGDKKLLYVKSTAPNLSVGGMEGTKIVTEPKPPPVITECADGRVITSGSCKQQ